MSRESIYFGAKGHNKTEEFTPEAVARGIDELLPGRTTGVLVERDPSYEHMRVFGASHEVTDWLQYNHLWRGEYAHLTLVNAGFWMTPSARLLFLTEATGNRPSPVPDGRIWTPNGYRTVRNMRPCNTHTTVPMRLEIPNPNAEFNPIIAESRRMGTVPLTSVRLERFR